MSETTAVLESQDASVQPAPASQPGGLVYVLHFTRPYKHARHYVGATGLPMEEREAAHRGVVLHEGDEPYGRAAKLVKALLRDGGDFVIADVFETDTLAQAFELEKRLKKQGSRARLCTICNPGNGRGLGRGKNRNGCRKRPSD